MEPKGNVGEPTVGNRTGKLKEGMKDKKEKNRREPKRDVGNRRDPYGARKEPKGTVGNPWKFGIQANTREPEGNKGTIGNRREP